MRDQNKNKDKFIDELMKSTYALSMAIDNTEDGDSTNFLTQFTQNYMKNSPFSSVKIRQKLNELQEKCKKKDEQIDYL